MAIKIGLGRLDLRRPYSELVPELIRVSGIVVLNISFDHTTQVSTLPLHHRDPFDRMLIAQAIVEGIPVLSADTAFDSYPITRVW